MSHRIYPDREVLHIDQVRLSESLSHTLDQMRLVLQFIQQLFRVFVADPQTVLYLTDGKNDVQITLPVDPALFPGQ